MIIRIRDGRYAALGDVKKMFNAVELAEVDWYVQCFLWIGMDETREPETYQVICNNMGVKPAGSIAKTALDKSANIHAEVYPETSQQLKD